MATGAVTTSPEPFEGRLAREAARSHGAALFAEHGTLIQRICRRLLRDEFEAEDAARAAVDMAQWRLDQRTVTAPVGGRVADLLAQPGETMAAGVASFVVLAAVAVAVALARGRRVPGALILLGILSAVAGLVGGWFSLRRPPKWGWRSSIA